MRIAVTGGSGKLGRGVIAVLRAAGHEVYNLDRAPAPGGPARGPGFIEVDLTDYGQVADALSGVDDVYDQLDAVVHLAAIPAPGLLSNVATFHNNMLSSYNVFEACRKSGIRRIIHASSETVLGLPFEVPPPYIPVDEEYPAIPNSTYSLVKHLEETMAAQLCRWDPELSVTGLRFSNVMDGSEYGGFRPSTPTRRCASGTSGRTSTSGMPARPSRKRSKPAAPVTRRSSLPTPTP
jgi:nucleoside-diphosphate-sugar epimerase